MKDKDETLHIRLCREPARQASPVAPPGHDRYQCRHGGEICRTSLNTGEVLGGAWRRKTTHAYFGNLAKSQNLGRMSDADDLLVIVAEAEADHSLTH